MKSKSLFPLFLLLFLMACQEQEVTTPVEPIDPERVDFQAPEVGQFNEYETIAYRCGEAIALERPDLRLEITAVTPTEIEFLETLDGQEVTRFTAERTAAGLRISAEERSRSNLLFFYGDDLIRLTADPTAEVHQQNCVFFDGNDKFTGEYVARTAEYTIGSYAMNDLKVVSCVPLILELDGYLLYDEHNLKASFTADAFSEEPNVQAFVLK